MQVDIFPKGVVFHLLFNIVNIITTRLPRGTYWSDASVQKVMTAASLIQKKKKSLRQTSLLILDIGLMYHVFLSGKSQ